MVNNRVKQISSDVIKNISGYAVTNYDFSKIKLYYFVVPIPSLNGYAGIDSIYVSWTQLLSFYDCLNSNLDSNSKLNLFKMNCVRLVQHEITQVVLRDLANDINISTPYNKVDIEESGLLAEIEHFGGRINWLESSECGDLNTDYCEYYIKKVENNEYVSFDCIKAKVKFYEHIPICMAVDMSDNELNSFYFE